MNTISHVGKTIANMRKRRNLTQQDLAHKIGSTKDRISEIENGKINMTFVTFFKICDALDCYGNITLKPF